MTELQREHNRKIEKLKAAKDRALVQREEKKIHAMAQYEVAVTHAEEGSSVMKTKAEGEKNIIENKARKQVMEMINRITSDWNAKKIDAEERAQVAEIEVSAQLTASRDRCEAQLKEAKAESDHAGNF